MTNKNFTLAIILAAFMQPVFAFDSTALQCIDNASKHYDLNKNLVMAIATVESSNCNQKATNYNAHNKSTDYGCMQVNSWWKPHLAKHGIDFSDVLKDKCLNIAIGAWVLKQNINTAKGDIWLAVGAYNAGWKKSREQARRVYAWKVYKEYKRISS